MKVTWYSVGLAVLLLALPACGARVAPSGSGFAQGGAGTVHDTQARDSLDENGVAPDANGDAASSTSTNATSTPNGTGTGRGAVATPTAPSSVSIALSADCVRPGDLLVVTITAPKKAGLGMIIGYSDNQPHGAMLTGQSDDKGMYVWRVVVEPTVPEGPAKVLVTATGPDWSQEGSGTANKSFQVAKTC